MSKGLKKFLAAAFAGVLMIGNVSALSVGAEEPYDVYNYVFLSQHKYSFASRIYRGQSRFRR